MRQHESQQQNSDESHDVERGDKIVVDGVRDSRNPMTVRVIYHDGAIKAIDQFKGKYRISVGDVADRVEVVDDEEDDSTDRTLNDYVDLGGLDCLQLDEDEEIVTDGGSETFVAHAAERAEADARQHEIEKDYGRAVIDDCGGWNWSLSVEEDGVVAARKAIPYDGAKVFKTEDTAQSRTSRRHGSQFGLTPEQVVDRYVRHSRTPHSVDDLIEDVETARSARGSRMTECSVKNCSNEAEFGLWLSDKEEISRVPAAPKDSEHKAGDPNPAPCSDHKALLAVKYQRLGEFRRLNDA